MKSTNGKLTILPQPLSADAFASVMDAADENDLRLLLWLRSFPTEDGVYTLADLADKLGLTDADVLASVKFWQGAGVLGKAKRTAPPSSVRENLPAKPVAAEDAPPVKRPKTLKRADVLPDYTSEELAVLLTDGRISPDFADKAQTVCGKLFTTAEMNTVIGMVESLGLPEEFVLTLLTYYNADSDLPLRYTEKVALSLSDQGIRTLPELNAYLAAEDARKTVEGELRALFGIGSRALTEREKTYFSAWTGEMNYSVDVIRLAYEITVDRKGAYNAAYLNGVLKGWKKDGLSTVEEIENALRDRQGNGVTTTNSSLSTANILDKALDTSWMDAFSSDGKGEKK